MKLSLELDLDIPEHREVLSLALEKMDRLSKTPSQQPVQQATQQLADARRELDQTLGVKRKMTRSEIASNAAKKRWLNAKIKKYSDGETEPLKPEPAPPPPSPTKPKAKAAPKSKPVDLSQATEVELNQFENVQGHMRPMREEVGVEQPKFPDGRELLEGTFEETDETSLEELMLSSLDTSEIQEIKERAERYEADRNN